MRRIGVAVVACLTLSGYLATPASADTPEAYQGSALGRALNLNLLGNQLTLGQATATVDSLLNAVAEGIGQLLPLAPNTVSRSEVAGGGSQTKPEQCFQLAPLGNLLSVKLACSSSSVQVVNNNPVASATGSVASVDLDLSTLLGALNLDQLLGLVNTVLNQVAALPVDQLLSNVTASLPIVNTLLAGLAPTLASTLNTVGDLTTALTQTVTTITNAVLTTKTLSIALGHSKSTVTAANGTVTSVADAPAGRIDVLPLGFLGLKPIVSVVLGQAKATATYNRANGETSAQFDPAIATVEVNLPLTGSITIPIRLGAPITILAGTPLESTISLGAGQTVRNADGSLGAIADGVVLHLLKGINGGIRLELGHAEAGVIGSLARIVPIPIANLPVPELPRELPRTGATPWVPLAGFTLMALALAGRRVVARAASR
ncbi:MAG: hypothetical protein ACRD0F_05275 [Acidimicrobiales bacterium]